MNSLLNVIIGVVLIVPGLASAKKIIDLSKHNSKVEFLAIGKPSLLKINGTGGKASGNLEIEDKKVTGTIAVPLNTLTTSIDLRDEHMKQKYLEIEKFPEATLKITDFTMDRNYLEVEGTQKNVPFKGLLKVHGVEKEVEGTADLESTKQLLRVVAQTNTNITNHSIDLPSYLGVKVADKVDIKVEFEIKK